MALGNMIENSLREIMADKEKEADLTTDDDGSNEDEQLERLLFADDSSERIRDEDFEAFKEFTDQLEEIDDDFLASLAAGEV